MPLDPSIVTVLHQGQRTSLSDDDVDVSDDVEGGSLLDGEVAFEGRVGGDGEETSCEDGDCRRKKERTNERGGSFWRGYRGAENAWGKVCDWF